MAVSQNLTLTETSVNTLENSSKVRILWKSTQTGGSYNSITRTAQYWIEINGVETEHSVDYTLPLRETKTILDLTVTVPHADDGTGTVKVRTRMDTRISAGVVTLSQTLALTPIATSSTIGATDAYIGSTSMIAINRKKDSYTQSVALAFGDLVGYIDESGYYSSVEVRHTRSTIPFTIPLVFYEYMTDAPEAECVLTCRTYDGDRKVGGDQTATFMIKANPADCAPQITPSVFDSNRVSVGLTGDSSVLVRYVSKVTCILDAQARYGASITRGTINGNAENVLEIPNVDINTFVFAAEDSRGFKTEKTVAAPMVPYIPLTLNVKITRTDPTSGNGRLVASGQCFGKSFGRLANELTLHYRINDSTEGEIVPTISGDGLSYSVDEVIPGLDYLISSNVVVTISDLIDNRSQTVVVKPGIPMFDWGEKDFAFHIPVSMGNNRIKEVGNPLKATDAATKAYVDSKTLVAKLWQNENILAAFGAQTIALDLSEVSGVEIIYYVEDTTDVTLNTGFIPVGRHSAMWYVTASYGHRLHRDFYVRKDGIEFTNGTNTGATQGSEVCIPLYILGWYGIDVAREEQPKSAICGTFLCGEVVAGQ